MRILKKKCKKYVFGWSFGWQKALVEITQKDFGWRNAGAEERRARADWESIKKSPVCLRRLGVPPPDPHVITSAYYCKVCRVHF